MNTIIYDNCDYASATSRKVAHKYDYVSYDGEVNTTRREKRK